MNGSHRGPRLSARLEAVAALIPGGASVLDVGTDHGLLPLALLASGRARRCIAGDASPEALAELSRIARDAPRPAVLEVRTGSGLRLLRSGELVDVVVLAGLGARTIERILDDPGRAAPWPFQRLVAQPQSEIPRVRRWLFDHAWEIVGEKLVLDGGRFYTVLAAEHRPSALAPPPGFERELLEEAGPCLLRSGEPLVAEYWRRRLAERRNVLRRAGAGPGREAARKHYEIARRVLEALI